MMQVFPKYLPKVCSDISRVAGKGQLNEQDLNLLGEMLHFAQPRNPAEELTKTVIQQMNRKNRKGFMKFITDSGLQHLVLWTDAATIVTHFKLKGVIYLKWGEGFYFVDFHKKYKKRNSQKKRHPLAEYKKRDSQKKKHPLAESKKQVTPKQNVEVPPDDGMPGDGFEPIKNKWGDREEPKKDEKGRVVVDN